MSLSIHTDFDGGAIEVIKLDAPDQIELALLPDNAADIVQWFYFRLDGAAHQACTLRMVNVTDAAFPGGWPGYRAMASYDQQDWFRVDTHFDGTQLIIQHTPSQPSIYFAYFEPYPETRRHALLTQIAGHPDVTIEHIAQGVQGRPVELITVSRGVPSRKVLASEAAPQAIVKKRPVWIVARQHPGETMAEWFVEGLLLRLLDRFDPVARGCLDRAVFYIVPNMNPDGSFLGNLRTNAAGKNLNRAWMAPSAADTPEVYGVRARIHQTGCHLFLDVHGDETIPYVFVAGSEMLPSFTPQQATAQAKFIDHFLFASPDFQATHGYEPSRYSADALTLASKYIGHTFGCLSLTLELPFKDNDNAPDLRHGWNGARSAALGAAALLPIYHVL